MTSHVDRTQPVNAVFCQFFHHLPSVNTIASYKYQKMNAFRNETCLNDKHQHFIFSTHVQFIWTLVGIHRWDRMRDATAAITASVVETTHRPGLFSSTTYSHPQANFLHQTCIAGLVKHLSPYTGCISECIWYLGNVFCPEKMNIITLFLPGQWRLSYGLTCVCQQVFK